MGRFITPGSTLQRCRFWSSELEEGLKCITPVGLFFGCLILSLKSLLVCFFKFCLTSFLEIMGSSKFIRWKSPLTKLRTEKVNPCHAI